MGIPQAGGPVVSVKTLGAQRPGARLCAQQKEAADASREARPEATRSLKLGGERRFRAPDTGLGTCTHSSPNLLIQSSRTTTQGPGGGGGPVGAACPHGSALLTRCFHPPRGEGWGSQQHRGRFHGPGTSEDPLGAGRPRARPPPGQPGPAPQSRLLSLGRRGPSRPPGSHFQMLRTRTPVHTASHVPSSFPDSGQTRLLALGVPPSHLLNPATPHPDPISKT